MGVSIYVMPLGRYLTRGFRTTWDLRRDLAGGKEGFRLGPDVIEQGPPPTRGLDEASAQEWMGSFRCSLRRRGVEPTWNEDGAVLLAISLSYASFGRIADIAGRLAGRVRFPHLADPMCPFWLPLRIPRPLEIPDPAGEGDPMKVLSSIDAGEELRRMLDLLAGDPRAEEVSGLPPRAVLTGSLAEYDADVRVVQEVLGAAACSAQSRLPLILEA